MAVKHGALTPPVSKAPIWFDPVASGQEPDLPRPFRPSSPRHGRRSATCLQRPPPDPASRSASRRETNTPARPPGGRRALPPDRPAQSRQRQAQLHRLLCASRGLVSPRPSSFRGPVGPLHQPAHGHLEFRKCSECEDSFDYVGSSSSWIRFSSKRDLSCRYK